MNLYSFTSLFVAFISIYFAVEPLKENFKSATNRIYATLLFLYALWSISDAFLHASYFRHEAILWYRIACVFAALTMTFLLIFIIYLSELQFLKRIREETIILLIPAVIVIYFFLQDNVVFDLIRLPDTWFILLNKKNLWSYIYYNYNLLCGFVACIITFISLLKEKSIRKKRMLISILIPGVITLMVNTILVILTFMNIFREAQNNFHIPVFLFFASTKFAITYFGMMKITPKVALQNILMNIKDFIILLDQEGNIIEINEELIKILNLTEKRVLPEDIELLINENRTNVKELVKKLNVSKTIILEGIIVGNNKKMPVSLYATTLIDKFNEINGYLIVGHDISELHELEIAKTEQKATENSLFESILQYKTTIDAINDMIFLVDTNLLITLCNKSLIDFLEKFGVDRYSIIGENIFNIFYFFGEDEDKEYKEVFSTGKIKVKEKEVKIKDEIITLEIRKIPVIEIDKINKIVTIIRDITLEKKHEEQLLRTSRLESLGVLAGGIAHDFNNMLTGIIGNINLAKNLIDAKSPIKNLLSDSEKAALRARELTYQLLTFSKGGQPIKKPGSIVELVQEASEFILRGSSIQVSFNIKGNIYFVEFDHGQMASVFHNIILNAREVLSDKKNGRIEITVENFDSYEGNIFNIPPGKYVKISISDNGPGIKKEYLGKIFDPYFTTKEKGHGLGLAISFSIIKKHGGFIDVSSIEGVGSTFYIYLPATEILPDTSFKEEVDTTSINCDILMMDDDETVRKISKKLLVYLGCNVTFAKNGEEAIEKYKKSIESNKPFDVVILDLTVKGGMGGKETIEKLYEIDKNIKAIVCSGYSNDPVLGEYKKYGFKGVIKKPFDMEDLRREILKVMNEK